MNNEKPAEESLDHRVLGKKLDLFSSNELTGAGLVLWHPKLAIVRQQIEDFWRAEHRRAGYQFAFTPHIASVEMFVRTRHYLKFSEGMFPPMLSEVHPEDSRVGGEQLKPMNCPNHCQVFNARPRSYRELPLRLAELGTVYRHEQAGAIQGLLRARGFTQDDSHIFCTREQAQAEIVGFLRLLRRIYARFGFNELTFYLATRPEKFLGQETGWEFAEASLAAALAAEGIAAEIDPGGGAFYGPKIDCKIRDSMGRSWQLGTIQFDFNLPCHAASEPQEVEDFWKIPWLQQRFKEKEKLANYLAQQGRGLEVCYVNSRGQQEEAVMLHRAVFGSLERFVGILIEHYQGAFPLWLAPLQVAILPVAQDQQGYAQQVADTLLAAEVRVEVWSAEDTLAKRIAEAAEQKLPYVAIVGARELAANTVELRAHGAKSSERVGIEQLMRQLGVQR
jgi:threonyl-tRNA synthetase